MGKIILRKQLNFENDICTYLNNIIKNKDHSKLAIVFDIDDTLIYTTKQNNQKIKKIYNLAVKHDIPVYIITARIFNKDNYNYTVSELIRHGFKRFQKLDLMPIQYYYKNSIGLYKFHVRKRISKNKTIILNIGDQWTDLFPNPTSGQKMSNDYYIFLNTNQGMLVKLKSLIRI